MKIVFLLLGFICIANAQWKQIGPRPYTGVIAIDPTDSQTIYIDAVEIHTSINRQVTGIRKTTDGGKNWTFFGLNEGLYFYDGGIRAILVDPHNPNILYVGGNSPAMAIGKSTDGGRSWVKSDSGIVPDHHGFTTQTMSFDSKRRILYAWDYSSFGGAYRSLDSARSWQLVLPDYGAFQSVVDTLTGTVYASTRVLSVSNDSGRTWSFYSNGITGNGSMTWLVKRQGSDTLYCINSATLHVSYADGKNWEPLTDTLLQRALLVRPIAISSQSSRVVYVGASPNRFTNQAGGLYRTTNGGVTWHIFADGLPVSNDSISINGIQIISSRVYTSVATNALPGFGGLFMREDVVTSVADESYTGGLFHFTLLDPYPNPFNPAVTIQFMIDKSQEIKLSIFDMLGREVIVLATGIRNAGLHRVQWSGTDTQGVTVPTGIYFVRLQSSQLTQTKKILLLR